MACCDSKKRFIWANIGDYGEKFYYHLFLNDFCYIKIITTGSFNDAGVFNNSDLGRSLCSRTH